MNQDAQLAAIAAEYQVAGYRATIDPSPEVFGLPADMPPLDIVVRRLDDALPEMPIGPRLIVIEIVNRRRKIVAQTGRGDDPYWAELDEVRAQERFEAIASALEAAGSADDDIEFQIRFLDVSADQALARDFPTFSPFDTGQLLDEMLTMRRRLAEGVKSPDDRALEIVACWSRTLRILAHRFPGRKHAEMQTADLRTIQKDLYDAGILDTRPSEYHRTHQSIMALFEGGEPEWPLLRGLQADLTILLDHIIAHYLDGAKINPDAPPIDEGAEHNLFEPLAAEINALEDPNVRRLAYEQFQILKRVDRTPAYLQALIDFEQTIARASGTFEPLLMQLRDRTRLISS